MALLLAEEYPTVTIVLDHLGAAVGPNLSDDEAAKWRADIASIASSCQNVVCKVGGIQMKINGWGWENRATPISSEEIAEATWPWYSHVIECFGPERCMFESNFPVDKDTCSYRTLWNAFKIIANRAGLSEPQKRDIFAETAMRVYSLVEPVNPVADAKL